jgi:pentatricopeptide repeat protein
MTKTMLAASHFQDPDKKEKFLRRTILISLLDSFCCHTSSLKNTLPFCVLMFVFVCRAMQNAKCKPTVAIYNSLINGYASAKMVAEAERLFHGLQRGSGLCPNTVTFNILIKMYINTQRRSQAEKLYSLMQQAGCKPDAVTFKTLHKAYSTSKNSLDAKKILLDMRKAGVGF